MNGVLIIDKPAGFTSHDVVNRVRRILGQRSVGHLGTLDPAATGVLPLVTGSFTRLAQFYTNSDKRYEGVIRFGFATTTYDAEGDPTAPPQDVTLNAEEIRTLAGQSQGLLQQVPPPFSAKKVAGVPSYKLARKQKAVALEPVEVDVKEFVILGVEGDCARFSAHVSSGTYLRSIAHDMGQKSGCGAHLASLRRTSVGEFTVEGAHTLEEVAAAAKAAAAKEGSREHLDALFVHPRKLLPEMPCVTATDATAALIRAGQAVNLPELSRARLVKVFAGQKELIAIATRIAGSLFHAGVVFQGGG